MRIAVCDDNEVFLTGIRQQLETLPLVENTSLFSDQNMLMEAVKKGECYDAVLLDIDLNGEKNGMDVAEELYRLSPKTRIIYITGYHDRFSQHIFLRQANLSGYLIKPVDMELLRANLLKIDKEMQPKEPVLMLQIGASMTAVPCHEIFYIESWNHVVRVYTNKEVITAYTTLRDIMTRLPDWFCQCHKSFAVNMHQIRRFQARDILMKNGAAVPVSRSRYGKAKEKYFRFAEELL